MDAFQAALRAGDIDRAAAYLDPGVVILESGGAEHSRDEYLAVHAPADAQFLKTVKITPGRRTARIEGDLAWVASLSEFEFEKEGQVAFIASAETMVLRRDAAGWKIVHIHWSSHSREVRRGRLSCLINRESLHLPDAPGDRARQRRALPDLRHGARADDADAWTTTRFRNSPISRAASGGRCR